jgi:(2Fe-2S) ferredoxin
MADEANTIQAAVEKIALHEVARHVFLCTGPKCCTPEDGQAAWDALKEAIRENGLKNGPKTCQRTKAGCLRICTGGPTMLVYPEGVWYHGMTAERIPRFVDEHLVGGKPIRSGSSPSTRSQLRSRSRETSGGATDNLASSNSVIRPASSTGDPTNGHPLRSPPPA